jgi:hypothetical protein
MVGPSGECADFIGVSRFVNLLLIMTNLGNRFASRSARKLRQQWGPWQLHAYGLKHTMSDYWIPWDRIQHGSDAFAWVIQISHKNRDLYGKSVVQDLVDAFRDVLCLYSMAHAAKPLDGLSLARAYRKRLKEQVEASA